MDCGCLGLTPYLQKVAASWECGSQVARPCELFLRETPNFYLYVQVPNFKILGNDSDIYYTTWT